MTERRPTESAARDARIGCILNDYFDRKARGQAESAADLLAAHPDLADELRAHLELISDLQPERVTLEGLVRQGILEACAEPGYPARFGAYKVSGLIGRGGMGIVLRAEEESLSRTVALKILRPELAGDTTAVARFAREARAAAALRHPNIVTVYAVGQERGIHFMAMEYVAGPTLAEVLRVGWPVGGGGRPVGRDVPVPQDVTATIGDMRLGGEPAATGNGSRLLPAAIIRFVIRQIFAGLAAAHQAGLIHRDIKPSNILLDFACGGSPPEGLAPGGALPAAAPSGALALTMPVVKIADFGLARMVSAQTRMTLPAAVLGTPEYMSPEQARGDEGIDQRTDLYSAGVVLYEMLAGRTPFRADSPSAVIQKILHEEPPDLRVVQRQVDARLAALALCLMAKEPVARLASASVVLQALENGRCQRPVGRRVRIRRWLALGICTTLLILGWTWWQFGAAGPGRGGYVRRIAGGSLNGAPIDATHCDLWVRPGEEIRGRLRVEACAPTDNSNAVIIIGATVSWGDPRSQCWQVNEAPWFKGDVPRQFEVHVAKSAPLQPGDYCIVVAAEPTMTLEFLMSATAWDQPEAKWGDGNDLGFDWTAEQLETALRGEPVLDKRFRGGTQRAQYRVPATAVRVHVAADS